MANDSEASSAAWNAAGQAASAGIAAIGQSVATKKQYERSKELMALQMQNQERMNESAYMRQMQMWEDTNFAAQREQLKKAGMSVGLMYGQGGGGGTTTGSNSAGSASGGASPQVGMDIGSIVQAAKMVAELGLMKATTKKTNAEARKANVEANVQEFGEQTGKDEYTVRSQELTAREQEIQAEMRAKEKYAYDGGNKTGWDMIAENEVKQSNSETQRKINETILQGIKAEEMKTNIEYTDEKKKAIWHEIRQKWTQAGFSGLGAIIKAVVTKGK